MNRAPLFFHSHDRQLLHWYAWDPKDPIKAVIILIHGLGEHIKRYDRFAALLALEGYKVCAFDQRGHGLTPGKQGFSPSFKHLLEDIHTFVMLQKMAHPDKKIILFGQSMGGNLVINYLLKFLPPVHGAIASSPALAPAYKIPAWKQLMGKIVRPVWPGLTLSSGFKTKDLSRDAQTVDAVYKDPLLHKKTTIDVGLSLIEEGTWAIEQAHTLAVPLYLQHGLADRVTSADASALFAKNAPQNLVRLALYENLYHELHNEPEAPMVFQKLLAWLHEVTH